MVREQFWATASCNRGRQHQRTGLERKVSDVQEHEFVLIRVEGVNIGAILSDTNDLSTRRGGGMMLLEAAQQASEWGAPAASISTGASTALLDAATAEKAKSSVRTIREKLKCDGYEHFTFCSSAVSGPNFQAAERGSLAAVRWQQQQRLSLALPILPNGNLGPSTSAVCTFDHVRPATELVRLPGEKTARLSESVIKRRARGRDLRQSFYKKLLGSIASAWHFTDDLKTLGDARGAGDVGNLSDKIALIYADGNKFGAIGQNAALPGELKRWDEYIKTQRKTVLRNLLERAYADPRMHVVNGDNQDCLRFETLLWGGDEFVFAVPAWCATAIWRHLYEESKTWTYAGRSLTHAFSMVFAHSNAPIHRLVELAKDLAEIGKKKHKEENSLTWTALESFDHMGLDLDAAMLRRYGEKVTWNDWVLSADQAVALDDFLYQSKAQLPRSQVVAGALFRIRENLDEARKHVEHADRQVFSPISGGGETAQKLLTQTLPQGPSQTSQGAAAWVQLAEAWDYFGHSPIATKGEAL